MLVVGHQDYRGTRFTVQLFQQLDDACPCRPVEVSCGLVREKDPRLIDEGTGDGHSLLLSTRKLRREMMQAVTQANALQQDSGSRLGVRNAAEVQWNLDVLYSRKCGNELEGLEYEADLFPAQPSSLVFAQRAEFYPVQDHSARGRCIEPRQQA